jgi:hypothetical protein
MVFHRKFQRRTRLGIRRPADHDQKHIEDEERNGNIVEESFFFRARTIVALSATVQKRNAARQVGLLPKPSS